MIDAAGAIYVLGGRYGYDTEYQDVWASTDGGARAGLSRAGVVGWGGRGGGEGTQGVLRGTVGIYTGTSTVLQGYPWGTKW